ncbi:MAG: transketolase [Candidatus Vogelbacteria bacterium CG22_combo_CG10-13_8_21_14_all_37_9]|uniref:Transketolase n=1 Tax=Candidatus Vogelbacteria bacterium CG22_combo_CG10-13_8_21_14_all_37_9 TaxID=1975046 RepID=A0A2H0BKK3_9BACT|nr:MAG: hypothetical protein BK005_02045 [bacterium CG10_37_50]PIP58161.1 MAG: transketolase [Candidatus Vogelbacteria bacterium CG22_combo_CG10-13_8_21_14_all_37_9]
MSVIKNISPVGAGQEIKRLVLMMTHKSHTDHLGSALSISDILAALYFKVLKINPKNHLDPKRDRFILSKGHGASALYATLALRGFYPLKELERYRINKGRFHGHPCHEAAPGIEVSTGSLGHGLSIGAGIALALKQKNNPARVYVLLGDGECQEGSIWEAAMFCVSNKLNSVIPIIDVNGWQGFGSTQNIHPGNLAKRWRGFGWQVLTCDGHDVTALIKTLNQARRATKATVVLAKTISGKGAPLIEDQLRAHYYILKEDEYTETIKSYEK